MSLMSRFFGEADAPSDVPESMQRIVMELDGYDASRARFLAAFAYVLARIAHADLDVDATEVAEMERTLRNVRPRRAGAEWAWRPCASRP